MRTIKVIGVKAGTRKVKGNPTMNIMQKIDHLLRWRSTVITNALGRWVRNRSLNGHKLWSLSQAGTDAWTKGDKKASKMFSLQHPLGFLVFVYVPKIWREMPGIDLNLDAGMTVRSNCGCPEHVAARAAIYAKHGEQSPELAHLS